MNMKNKINVLILSFKSELLQVLEEKCFKNKHLQLSRINTGTASSYVSILKAVHSPVCMLMFFFPEIKETDQAGGVFALEIRNSTYIHVGTPCP